jgi:hypothetical protein
MLAALAIVVTTLAQAAGQTAPDAGSLAGCISDASGQRLPGVTILAQLPGVRRTTEADTTGCYELKDLGPGSYRVIARLRGFTRRLLRTIRTDISFLQNLSGPTDPYEVGEELVVFFDSSNVPFTIINDNPGLNIGDTDHMSMVFRVRDGRIQDAPSDLRNYVGMRLDAFLEELRSGTRRSDVRDR